MRTDCPALPRLRRRLTLAALAVAGLLTGAGQTLAAADVATLVNLGKGAQSDGFLAPEEAFQVEARATAPDRIEISYRIAKGYYLYRNKLKFSTPANDRAALGQPALPEGESKTDEYFGTQQVYHQDFVAQLPVSRGGAATLTLPVKLTWQREEDLSHDQYRPMGLVRVRLGADAAGRGSWCRHRRRR